MTSKEIKNILKNHERKIIINVIGNSLILEAENILLSNNYRWAGYPNGIYYLHKMDNKIDGILFYINYNGNQPFILMYVESRETRYHLDRSECDLLISDEKMLNIFRDSFLSIPDYSPRTISRDI